MSLKQHLLCILIPVSIMPAVIFFFFLRLFPSLHPIYLFLIIILTTASAIYVGYSLAASVASNVKDLKGELQRLSKGDLDAPVSYIATPHEMAILSEDLEKMRKNLVKHGELEAKENSLRAKETIARQVAHDIVSPLSSIQMVLGFFRLMKQDDEVASVSKEDLDANLNVLELASQRLKNIAEDLLEQRNEARRAGQPFSIHAVLDELIGELTGRSDYKDIEFVKHYYNYAINIAGDRKKIQRAFNNIIKNAFEAMDGRGRITISTALKYESSDGGRAQDERVVVSIRDSGPGIGEEKIKKLLTTGFTEGKKQGHGIGLQFVRQVVREHRGSLDIFSVPGEGATFSIILPLHAVAADERRPDVSKESFIISIEKDKPVIVMDDDLSLLEQWKLVLKKAGVRSVLCNSYEDFCKKAISPDMSHTVIVDFHYNNSEWNGLQIVSELYNKGFKNVYLCTAEYWKPSLKENAKRAGVAICPKPLPNILVKELDSLGEAADARTRSREKIDCVLIDDEELVRNTWNTVAKIKGKKIISLSDPREFYGLIGTIDKDTAIYIDSNLKNGIKGENVARDLNQKGFEKIYLTTGSHKSEFAPMPWIKDIIDKKPPFLSA